MMLKPGFLASAGFAPDLGLLRLGLKRRIFLYLYRIEKKTLSVIGSTRIKKTHICMASMINKTYICYATRI